MKTLTLAKTSSFFKRIKVLYFLKGISCNHDYSAYKNIRFLGVCVETETARTICT